MKQLDLFDHESAGISQYGTHLSRSTDPPTSKLAASEVDLSGAKAAFVMALKDLGRPATANEIGQRAVDMGLARVAETVRKRSAELEDLRVIQVDGLIRCSVTSKLAEGWKLFS